ncbi:MAG: hypothetical protein U0556_19765 [Dehalococcoidia bacterium]
MQPFNREVHRDDALPAIDDKPFGQRWRDEPFRTERTLSGDRRFRRQFTSHPIQPVSIDKRVADPRDPRRRQPEAGNDRPDTWFGQQRQAAGQLPEAAEPFDPL